jgi:hypothetical protein
MDTWGDTTASNRIQFLGFKLPNRVTIGDIGYITIKIPGLIVNVLFFKHFFRVKVSYRKSIEKKKK